VFSPYHRAIMGSEQQPAPGARAVRAIDADERLRITVYVRRNPRRDWDPAGHTAAGSQSAERESCTRASAGVAPEASPYDLARVEDFAYEYGLNVAASDRAARSAVLFGDAAAISAAFGVALSIYETPHGAYRGYRGYVYVPEQLDGIVEAVLGLDDRRVSAPDSALRQPLLGGHSAQGSILAADAQTVDLNSLPGASLSERFALLIHKTLKSGEFGCEEAQTWVERSSPGGLPVFEEIRLAGPVSILGDDAGFVAGAMSQNRVQPQNSTSAAAVGKKLEVYVTRSTEQGWVDSVTEAVTRQIPLNRLWVTDDQISDAGPSSHWTDSAVARLDEAIMAAATRGTAIISPILGPAAVKPERGASHQY